MPDFGLAEREARDLAAFILSRGLPAEPLDLLDADPSRGRRELESSGCLTCHALDGAENRRRAPSLAEVSRAPRKGCLADSPEGRGNAPDFELSQGDRRAIREVLSRALDSLERTSSVEYAARRIEALRCRACHIRDGRLDDWSRLTGRADLTADIAAVSSPPDPFAPSGSGSSPEGTGEVVQDRPRLTWTGEKLRGRWLERFLEGAVDARVHPWLDARMPRFAFRSDLIARGLAAEHGVPYDLPAEDGDDSGKRVDEDTAEKLLGPNGGFNCVACHDLGSRRATGAFDARGPDLLLAPERLRKDFYFRWMMNPQRITPGTRMPQFATDGRSAVIDVLEGDAERQFRAIWRYLEKQNELENRKPRAGR